MSKVKAVLILPAAKTGEMAIGNSKLNSVSAAITKVFSESLLLAEQIKM